MLSRGKFWAVADQQDAAALQSYIRTIEAAIPGIAVVFILFFAIVAFSCLAHGLSTSISIFEESTEAQASPAICGAEPMKRVYDDTGVLENYILEDIDRYFHWLAEDLRIQVALYNSTQPAHDVYDEIFDDERGIVVYVEESVASARVSYFWGDELDGIFTEKNVQRLDEAQVYLEGKVSERPRYVAYQFDQGLRALFQNTPPTTELTVRANYLGAFVWFCVGSIMATLCYAALFYRIGLPILFWHRRRLYDALLLNLGHRDSASGGLQPH